MVAVWQRFSGLVMQELWPNVADFFQTRGSVLIVGQAILPRVPSGEAFPGGSSGCRRVPASRRRRLRSGSSQDRLPHHSRRQSPITRKCVALGRSTCIPKPGNLCRPRRLPSCLFGAPLGGMAKGGFAATTAEVKRMLTARVRKLSAESLPLTACGEAALRHRLTHAD